VLFSFQLSAISYQLSPFTYRLLSYRLSAASLTTES